MPDRKPRPDCFGNDEGIPETSEFRRFGNSLRSFPKQNFGLHRSFRSGTNYDRPTQIKRLSGVGGTQEVVSQMVDTVRLNHIELSNCHMEFGDLQNKYGINGFIGTDILSQFRINIDFLNQEIHFIFS